MMTIIKATTTENKNCTPITEMQIKGFISSAVDKSPMSLHTAEEIIHEYLENIDRRNAQCAVFDYIIDGEKHPCGWLKTLEVWHVNSQSVKDRLVATLVVEEVEQDPLFPWL